MNADQIKQQIKQSDPHAIGALLKLYSHQTPDEQIAKGTAHDNAVGFNGADAGILSDIADFYLRRGKISPKQIALIRPKLYKYCNQLANLGGIEPVKTNGWQDHTKSTRTKQPKPKKYAEEIEGDRIRVCFPYDVEVVDAIRNIPGREYVKQQRCWIVPKSISAITVLVDLSFDIHNGLTEWWEQYRDVKDMDPDSIQLEGFRTELYPFQKQGVAFIESRNGKGLIADDMGLGKTIQALAYLHKHPELRPALVVVPASVKLNWRNEARRFMDPEPEIALLQGKTPIPYEVGDDITIINYDIIWYWRRALYEKRFKVLVLDEAHRIKNSDALRTKAVMALAKGVGGVIALTGTPILNRPIEIFNCLKLLKPDMFRSRWAFAKRYCNLRHNGYGWDMTGASNKGELHKILSEEIMIRRLKSEVLTELPDKQRIPMPVEMTPGGMREYKRAEADFISYLSAIDPKKASKAARAKVLAEIEGLKQLALKGKMSACLQWINDFLEDTDQKLVVFAVHHYAVDRLMEEYDKIAVKIDGRVDQNKRQDIVDRFQTDPNIRLFVGNVQAAGEGITLTAASNCLFIEFPWTPGALEQASDRIHRIGQEADSVNIYYLVAERTIDERIIRVLDAKRRTIQEIMDGVSVDEQESTLSALLEEYRNG